MRMVSFIVGAVWLIVGVCCLRTGKKGTPGERRYALTMGRSTCCLPPRESPGRWRTAASCF